MIDQKDRDALLKIGVYALMLCLGALFLAVVLGLSIHVVRLIGGI